MGEQLPIAPDPDKVAEVLRDIAKRYDIEEIPVSAYDFFVLLPDEAKRDLNMLDVEEEIGELTPEEREPVILATLYMNGKVLPK